MEKLLSGKEVAEKITENLINETNELKGKGIIPTLAILRVGENPSDLSYEKNAMKRCEKIGIAIKNIVLKPDCKKEDIFKEINNVNNDKSIHGLLMFRPLPDKSWEAEISNLLKPKKDIDCMTTGSLSSVFTGKGDGFAPCTAESVMEILDYYNIDPTSKNVVVLGRSLVIGKPVSMLLQNKNATVTMCHSKTKNLPEICKNADIIVSAMGKAKFVTKDFVNNNQIIIDVGINFVDGKMCGDVDFDNIKDIVSMITPVPGGVGAVTTSVLAKHVIMSAKAN